MSIKSMQEKINKYFKLSEKNQKELIERNLFKHQERVLLFLKSKHIIFEEKIKEKWGTIFVFTLRGKMIFICEIAIFKKGKPELWYYSDEYSCKRCYMKI